MKQVPQPQRLTQDWRSVEHSAWAQLLDGLLAVCRARERGEPWWMLDVRRAQARISAARARERRTNQEPGES